MPAWGFRQAQRALPTAEYEPEVRYNNSALADAQSVLLVCYSPPSSGVWHHRGSRLLVTSYEITKVRTMGINPPVFEPEMAFLVRIGYSA